MACDEDRYCPDCEGSLTRRDFVKTVGATAAAASAVPLVSARPSHAAPTSKSAAEDAVARFYATLSEAQKKEICLPFNHPKRSKISANWRVTKHKIGSDFYTDGQRALIDEIVRGVTSEDGYERLQRQMKEDWGGFDNYCVAVFGEPDTETFQWEMTGRHLTMRADGNTVPGRAFGGPIVYGHGKSNPDKNLFHYQTKKANEVFGSLDPGQRRQALLPEAPPESRVPVQGAQAEFPGIAVGDLSEDQQDLVERVIGVILAPYRNEDVEEAMAILKQGGGFEKLHLAFYQEGDLKSDKVWDIWRVEGPSFVWHFRGAPHVHTYVNIAAKASQPAES